MRECQKKISSCFIDSSKDFDCLNNEKLRLVSKEMATASDCFHAQPISGQEITVRKEYGGIEYKETEWLSVGKSARQRCIQSVQSAHRTYHKESWIRFR